MYSRTQNENGTYNTRCLHCMMTVASAVETDGELDERERRHVCPERALAELLADQAKRLETDGAAGVADQGCAAAGRSTGGRFWPPILR